MSAAKEKPLNPEPSKSQTFGQRLIAWVQGRKAVIWVRSAIHRLDWFVLGIEPGGFGLGQEIATDDLNQRVVVPKDEITKLQYFEIFRQYRMCEQGLINHRLTWNLAIQGFLLGGYGVCLQKLVELQQQAQVPASPAFLLHNHVAQLDSLTHSIPWIGLAFALFIFVAVLGSKIALKNLQREWHLHVENKQPLPYTPNPAGGGSRWAVRLGFLPPFSIPLLFMWVWIYLRR
jgi:hypothetical protein